jgi:hydrogenase expression/formation protein HypD
VKHTPTEKLIAEIESLSRDVPPVQLMEICGTHTVSLFRTGVKSLLPESVRMISGPGCPVCVTSQAYVDVACELAARSDVTVCTFGDMVRVPGRQGSLEHQRARGGQLVVVFSARDALKYAIEHPDRKVVFLAVGFETTAPGTAAALLEAKARGIENFLVLSGHKLVIPAMSALLAAGDVPIDGFLCPGHVSIIIGTNAFEPIATTFNKPCVVTGFEPREMLRGMQMILEQVREGRADVENAYPVAVKPEGNPQAMQMLNRVFEPDDAMWRAIGTIPSSGLALRDEYRSFDAMHVLDLEMGEDYELPGCRCGDVIQGKLNPDKCPLFATRCTPMQPVGPCMVSSEGTCAAWFKYSSAARERMTNRQNRS